MPRKRATTPDPAPDARPDRVPGTTSTPLSDLVGILERQRTALAGMALATAVLGIAVAAVAPGVLPPHPLVGAAVGFAAVLVGLAAAVAVDAGDEVVRGPRHVRATGAPVAAWGRDPVPALVAWCNERIQEAGGLRLAVVAAGGNSRRAGPLAETLGTALARAGNRVLVADLSVPSADRPGVAEVGRGEVRLADAVAYDEALSLARIGSGESLVDGLTALPGVTARLSGDVDVLIAALPGLRYPGSLLGATATDRALLLAIEDESTRVDVIAGLDALDAARAPADVVVVPPDVRFRAEAAQPARRSRGTGDAGGREGGAPDGAIGSPDVRADGQVPDPAPPLDPEPAPSPPPAPERRPPPGPLEPDPEPRPRPDPLEPVPPPEPEPEPDPGRPPVPEPEPPVPAPRPEPPVPPGPEVPEPIREPRRPDAPPEIPEPVREPDPPAAPPEVPPRSSSRAPEQVDTGPISPPEVEDDHEILAELRELAAVIALEEAVARRAADESVRGDAS